MAGNAINTTDHYIITDSNFEMLLQVATWQHNIMVNSLTADQKPGACCATLAYSTFHTVHVNEL